MFLTFAMNIASFYLLHRYTTAIYVILLYMYIRKVCMRMRCGNISDVPVMLEGRSQNLVVLSNNFLADLLYSEINLFVEQMRLAIHSLNTP